jgi:hypothetical protein
MIKYRSQSNLDIKKYDNCIANSSNARIYAFSWYLNCVSDNWDVLVYNDYEAVMPLPIRKKYGINYIYLPPWVQQLGVFSENEIESVLICKFIKKIPKKNVLIDYYFNSQNRFSSNSVNNRINFILPLNKSFETIKKNYNKNRKRITGKDIINYSIDKKGDKNDFLTLYKNQIKNYNTQKDSITKLQYLISVSNGFVNIWNVYKNDKIVAGLVWLKDEKRVTYLVPVATIDAKKDNIPAFIVNELIKEHQCTDYILDFEGSMVEGIAQFYKSFGAIMEEYYWYKKWF